MGHRPKLGAVAIAGAVLALCGCGGRSATRSDVIARGNAICASEIRDVRAVAAPTSLNSMGDLAGYLERVVPIVRGEVSSLKALPRPATDRAELESFIAAAARDGLQYRVLAIAAANRDRAGVESALTSLRLSPTASLARRYGLTQCASAVGTGVP